MKKNQEVYTNKKFKKNNNKFETSKSNIKEKVNYFKNEININLNNLKDEINSKIKADSKSNNIYKQPPKLGFNSIIYEKKNNNLKKNNDINTKKINIALNLENMKENEEEILNCIQKQNNYLKVRDFNIKGSKLLINNNIMTIKESQLNKRLFGELSYKETPTYKNNKKFENLTLINNENFYFSHNKKFNESLTVYNENFNIIQNIKSFNNLSIFNVVKNEYFSSKSKNAFLKKLSLNHFNLDIPKKFISKTNILSKRNQFSITIPSKKKNFSEKSKKTSSTKNSSDTLIEKEITPEEVIPLSNNPKGLENFSLNCYMNSLLQCLYHIKQFRSYFINPENYSSETQKICHNISKIFKGLTNTNQKFFSPKDFKKVIDQNSLFSGIKGADVSDLLNEIIFSILNEISNEDNISNNTDNEEDNTNKEKCFIDAKKNIDMNNPINKIFMYLEEIIYNCPKCNNNCYTIQDQTTIDFNLLSISKKYGNELDLNKCFDFNFNNNEKKKFFCCKCNRQNNGDMNIKIMNVPKNLIIILHRGKDEKFEGNVDFDEYIDISKYIDDTFINKNKKNFLYKLIGVSTHIGESSDEGHYIAFCYREKEKKYFCFNDKQTEEAEFEDLKNHAPYILFYELTNNIQDNSLSESNGKFIHKNPIELKKLKDKLTKILDDSKSEKHSFIIDYFSEILMNPLQWCLLLNNKIKLKMIFSEDFPKTLPTIILDYDEDQKKELENIFKGINSFFQYKRSIIKFIGEIEKELL